MNEQQELDKETAKNAIRVYLQHFLIPERTAIIEALICELADEETINESWIEMVRR